MIDARWLNTIRSYVNRITLMQELIVLAGVILFFVGLAAPDIFPKIIALTASVGAFAYIFESLRRQSLRDPREEFDSPIQMKDEVKNVSSKKVDSDEERKSQPLIEREIQTTVNPMQDPTTPSPLVGERPLEYKFDIADFCDTDEDAFSGSSGAKSEFSYLIKKVLGLIKEVSFGYTVAFWWVNREKNQLVLESYVTESSQFSAHRRRELGYDLISQVAHSGLPRIVNQLSPAGQTEALGYYQNLEGVRSFVAVPVFFPRGPQVDERPVAVLSLDFLGEDIFGPENMVMLGQFAKTISALIKSYTGKYDLLIDSEVLRSIGRLRDQMEIDFTLHSVIRSMAEETSRLVAWDYIAAVIFDEQRKTWQVQMVINRMNDGYVAVGQEIDPNDSLVGDVIQSSAAKILDSSALLKKPRFYHAERVDSKGAVMILPINSINRCYGALVVESKDTKTYSESDAKMLQKIIDTSSAALEIYSLNDIVNNYVLLDETTGVATRKYFMERIHQEVERSKDYDSDVTVVMFSVDSMNDQLNRLGKDGFDFVLQNIGRIIKTFIRSYDLIGRFDFNRFAVYLINTSLNEAYIWAEKVRKNIASNIINIDQKSFSVTVSVGICGSQNVGNDIELMEHASQVLSKATEAGGNMVRVY